MKRCMEIIRKILEYAEAQESLWFDPPHVEGVEPERVHYHVGLCGQAGLLDIDDNSVHNVAYPRYRIEGLTWQGHEELKRMRCANGRAHSVDANCNC